MRELSIMVDESGEWGKLSKYYLITLVFHDQSEPVMPHIERYEQHLADASLPDIPFHAGPLLNGHADYETLSMADRKRLFVAFFTLARNLPFTYVTFAHRKSEFDNDKRRFEAQLRRDLANYLLTHLDRFHVRHHQDLLRQRTAGRYQRVEGIHRLCTLQGSGHLPQSRP